MPAASTAYRPGRLRQREALRTLTRETRLSVEQLIMPLFVRAGKNVRAPISSMPGQFQLSVDQIVKECQELKGHGVRAVLLFGLADRKDEKGSNAFAKDGLVQQAVRAIRAQVPDVLVTTDVCLCAYTTHGHCGVIRARGAQKKAAKSSRTTRADLTERDFSIDRDATLALLAKIAISHAEAGADMVAPSDMMDGNVGAIRRALDAGGFERLPIMAYSAKFASTMYAPFRQAVDSAPAFSDRRTYQMDPANIEEALREARQDIDEGADILIVKPALSFLDVIYRIKQAFHHPVAAFNVSGEYSMVKAAAARGWLPERPVWFESLLSMKRAGADLLITYWAKDAAKWLQEPK